MKLTGPEPAISTAPNELRNPCSPQTQPAEHEQRKKEKNSKPHSDQFKWAFNIQQQHINIPGIQ